MEPRHLLLRREFGAVGAPRIPGRSRSHSSPTRLPPPPAQLAVNSAAILLLGSGLQTVAFPAGRALGVLAVSLLTTSTLTILACAVLFVATDDEDYL